MRVLENCERIERIFCAGEKIYFSYECSVSRDLNEIGRSFLLRYFFVPEILYWKL